MLYFKRTKDTMQISSEYQPGTDWVNRNDFKTFAQAEEMAKAANVIGFEGGLLVATDSGPSVSPRYDVIRLPTVGDKVSYAFNGDSYPDGEIVSVSKSLRVVRTSTGSAFYRRRNTGAWIKNGTWSLTQGHVYKQNPSF